MSFSFWRLNPNCHLFGGLGTWVLRRTTGSYCHWLFQWVSYSRVCVHTLACMYIPFICVSLFKIKAPWVGNSMPFSSLTLVSLRCNAWVLLNFFVYIFCGFFILKILELLNNRIFQSRSGHKKTVQHMQFTADEKTLISSSDDSSIQVKERINS